MPAWHNFSDASEIFVPGFPRIQQGRYVIPGTVFRTPEIFVPGLPRVQQGHHAISGTETQKKGLLLLYIRVIHPCLYYIQVLVFLYNNNNKKLCFCVRNRLNAV